jgi:hypothetical protein
VAAIYCVETKYAAGELVEEGLAGPHHEVHLLLPGSLLVHRGGLLLSANVLLLEANLFVAFISLLIAGEDAIAIYGIGEPVVHPAVVGIEANLKRGHALEGRLLPRTASELHVETRRGEHRLDTLSALYRGFLRGASDRSQEGESGESTGERLGDWTHNKFIRGRGIGRQPDGS